LKKDGNPDGTVTDRQLKFYQQIARGDLYLNHGGAAANPKIIYVYEYLTVENLHTTLLFWPCQVSHLREGKNHL